MKFPNTVFPLITAACFCLIDIARAQNDEEAVNTVFFGSCIDQELPIPILDTILSHKPDVFVFLGDNIYADTEDMEVMRMKYEKLGANQKFRQLMGASRILATWDDHDYGVNDGGARYPKRVESEKLFLDFWRDPMDSPVRKRPGIFTSKRLGPEGKRLQIILLDTRYFRSPLKKGEKRVGGSWVPDEDSEKSMLGSAQWKWLEQQLREPAQIRIIVSSIQCVAQDAGQETWSNLPFERRRLFRLIEDTEATGCFFISGDRHWSELSVTDENVPYPLYDLTSSSLNKKHARGTPTENCHRAHPTTYHNENFGTIHIDWGGEEPTVKLGIRDIQDKVQLEKVISVGSLRRAR